VAEFDDAASTRTPRRLMEDSMKALQGSSMDDLQKKFEGFIKPGSREALLLMQIRPEQLPHHVAIIMDGNGRWALRRHKPRIVGHRAGAKAARRIVETAARLGIPVLTLYAFSTENWKRPQEEIAALMSLLREFLRKELETLKRHDIRLRVIGRWEGLEGEIREELRRAMAETAGNQRMHLVVALNYSGRTELVDAFRRLYGEARQRALPPEAITEALIAQHLYTADLPDPDLLIRTSGEMRVSNFLLWQIAYTELYVTETLWPDFRPAHFLQALIEYQRRERRYGGLSVVGGPSVAHP
jgi:undecaprenyl diphosphate synthase